MSTKRGAAQPALLVVLLSAVLLALIVWWRWSATSASSSAGQPAPPAPTPEVLVDRPDSERIDRPATTTPGDRRYLPELFDPARFDGVARLEVVLDAPADFLGPWTLALTPSRVVTGGERAVGRSLEIRAGERSVVLTDVALGGYEIRALAEGMECATQFVQFAKPDELDVILPIRLFAAGDLAGRVLDPDGAPVADMPLIARRNAPSLERQARTDAAGYYVFQRLPDGDYSVSVGYPEAPLVARELSFAAPGFTMPDLVTPRLATLFARVVDTRNQPVVGAKVSVLGLPSGAREGLTDTLGVARLPHCAEGPASLIVEASDYAVATEQIHFQPGLVSEHQVRLAAR